MEGVLYSTKRANLGWLTIAIILAKVARCSFALWILARKQLLPKEGKQCVYSLAHTTWPSNSPNPQKIIKKTWAQNIIKREMGKALLTWPYQYAELLLIDISSIISYQANLSINRYVGVMIWSYRHLLLSFVTPPPKLLVYKPMASHHWTPILLLLQPTSLP